MQISANGLNKLKNEEGFRSKPYKCAAGKDTIGYGTRITPAEVEKYKQEPMTREEAEIRCRNKCVQIVLIIQQNVRVQLNQNQVDALISFIYNIGVDAFKTSTFLKKLNNKSFTGAAQELARWCHDDHGNVIKGLQNRREREKALFLQPLAPQPVAKKE
ncbi:MAG: lysozyme [Bacteroidetes bacterium]|nr:lysozyme [Bacteroidota bacterium]